jgi:phage baseplate assembly protein W
MNIIKNFNDNWAADFDKNMLNYGEIKDIDVINQSIELIVGTNPGERIFNISFGSGLQQYLFENISESVGEAILDLVIESIKRWEDRILIQESDCRLLVEADNNEITLTIPYIIKKLNIKSVFQKKIIQ